MLRAPRETRAVEAVILGRIVQPVTWKISTGVLGGRATAARGVHKPRQEPQLSRQPELHVKSSILKNAHQLDFEPPRPVGGAPPIKSSKRARRSLSRVRRPAHYSATRIGPSHQREANYSLAGLRRPGRVGRAGRAGRGGRG